jgi:hypothetical protein
MALDLLPPPNGDPAPDSSVRILTEAEIATLEPTFAEHGVLLPDPSSSFIVGSVDQGQVVAFLVVQLRIHAEPMWIKPGHQSLFSSLVHVTEKLLAERAAPCDVFLFAPAGKVSTLAEKAGMRL